MFSPVLTPSTMSTKTRQRFAAVIHAVWEWVCAVGSVSPDDERGRRYRRLGAGSCLSFPPGAVFGERWIAIGTETLIGPQVNLSVGMPGEPRDDDDPPVLVIGDRCNIGRGSSIAARAGIVIEDDVTTAPDVYVTDHNHTYGLVDVPITRQWPAEDPVHIGAGSWIGAGVTVLPGTRLGRNVTVGAGSVVRGVFPDHCVIAGVPAKIVRRHIGGVWEPPIGPQVIRPPADWDVYRT